MSAETTLVEESGVSDKGYDVAAFVEAFRDRQVTPHTAPVPSRRRGNPKSAQMVTLFSSLLGDLL